MSKQVAKGRARSGLVVLALSAVVVAGAGIAVRIQSKAELVAWTAEQAIPSVALVYPEAVAADGGLTLPSTLQALNSAPIHARTSGYLREWRVDIGDQVARGQVLANLDAPEVEQQLVQARADLETTRANRNLAKTTADRWETLLERGVVSKQAADERRADLAARSAAVNAAQANVSRLQAMVGFTQLTAPFDGVVISRSAEIGELISAGGASDAPLFTVADISRIRASVRVPQLYSGRIQPGMTAQLLLPELPGQSFAAEVTRSAGAVDPSSGTVLIEVMADNAGRQLKPGAYAQVRFRLPDNDNLVTVPPSVLIMGADGPRVAMVDDSGKAQLRPITLGRDRGRVVEVAAGLTASDAIIDNPPDSLRAGDAVRIANR